MKLSDGVEQAIHVAAFLGGLPEGAVMSAAALAEFHGVSASYLLKHLQALSGAGILQTVPGPLGGYRLGRAPLDISLLDRRFIFYDVACITHPTKKAGYTHQYNFLAYCNISGRFFCRNVAWAKRCFRKKLVLVWPSGMGICRAWKAMANYSWSRIYYLGNNHIPGH